MLKIQIPNLIKIIKRNEFEFVGGFGKAETIIVKAKRAEENIKNPPKCSNIKKPLMIPSNKSFLRKTMKIFGKSQPFFTIIGLPCHSRMENFCKIIVMLENSPIIKI